LEKGDTFRATAPYGDLVFQTEPGRRVCFISTGTGLAPFRSMMMSRGLQQGVREGLYPHVISICGVRDEKEIIYPGLFEAQGVEVVDALSRPADSWRGFTGRVTDFLKTLPLDWGWHATDFYLCGNGAMILDVLKIIRDGHGVRDEAIHKEIYYAPSAPMIAHKKKAA
jgi:ferredoxin-NADP reductase